MTWFTGAHKKLLSLKAALVSIKPASRYRTIAPAISDCSGEGWLFHSLPVEEDEPLDPADVCLFSANRIVLHADHLANLRQQASLGIRNELGRRKCSLSRLNIGEPQSPGLFLTNGRARLKFRNAVFKGSP